jgi:hypothetical protein
MKKIAILGFLMFFLATSLVSALIIKPELSLIAPKTTDVLNGVVKIEAKLIYKNDTINTTLATPTQMLFEYSSMPRRDCYANTKCKHAKLVADKKGSDGWSTSWSTKNLSDGEYYVHVYAFAGDSGQFLITDEEFGPFNVNQSGKTYSYQSGNTTQNQTMAQNMTQNMTQAMNQTQNQTMNQTEEPVIEKNETTIEIDMPKEEEQTGIFYKMFKNFGLLLRKIFLN